MPFSNDDKEMKAYQKKLIEQRRPSLEIFEQIAGIRKRIENLRLDRSREITRHKATGRTIDEQEDIVLQELFGCLDRLNNIHLKNIRRSDKK